MKPISIEFQAFGPYKGREIIEFDKLPHSEPFLICGETGSGKTMILDAITFALYGESSGNARNDLEEMRCNRCDRDTATFVSFVFEQGGEIYKFERRVEMKRTNMSCSQNVFIKDAAGGFQPVFQNAKLKDVKDMAAKLIGLSADQFRQVIVLPQGQFERFLVSDSSEKEKILDKIFNAGKWEKYAAVFYRYAEEEYRLLDEKRAEYRSILSQNGCETFDKLLEMIEQKREYLDSQRKAFLEENIEDRLKMLGENKLNAQSFLELHKQESELEGLMLKKPEIEQFEAMLLRAEKAEPFADYIGKLNKLSEDEAGRRRSLLEAEKNLAASEKGFFLAEEKYNNHIAGRQKRDEAYARGNLLKGKEELYHKLKSVENSYNAAVKELEEAKSGYQKEVKKQEELMVRLAQLLSKQREKRSAYENVLSKYYANIGGILAKELTDGLKCPVCGSINHPEPAPLSEDISRNTVEEAKKSSEAADRQREVADNERVMQDNAVKLALSLVNEADRRLSEASKDLSLARENLEEGIASEAELLKEIDRLEKCVSDYDKAVNELSDARAGAANRRAADMSAVKTASEEYKLIVKNKTLAESELEKMISKSDFDSIEAVKGSIIPVGEQKNLQDRISSYRSGVAAIKKQIEDRKKMLSGKTETKLPDIEALERELTTRKEEFIRFEASQKEKLEALDAAKKEVQCRLEYTEKNETRVNDLVAFGRKLRGDNGTGLKRYVLAIMFSNVIAAANEMLDKVHAGRYHLMRSDEKVSGSRKSGLNLKVIDNYSGDNNGRNVSTLSGGEKFLVSLALSIGMSSIASSSGIRIEAMFIDEGFGTLDENSISDAMDILNDIRKSKGMVGIISHVELLRSNLGTKIVVEKTRESSYIRRVTG